MTNTQFTEIARFYDDLMRNVPYHLWVEYVEEILERLHRHPKTVLDAACGTGVVSEMLAELGYEVTGVDISPAMVEVAQGKAGRSGGVQYLVQDLASLDIGRRFDLIISLFDSLNYIIDPNRLRQAIYRIAAHLEPGGVFIFDVNTEYALSHGFFNQTNLGSSQYPKYVWSSSYDKSTRLCTVTMVFEALDNGERRQFTEIHYQRGYSVEELHEILDKAELAVVDVFQAYSFSPPRRRSDRLFFVARKPGGED